MSTLEYFFKISIKGLVFDDQGRVMLLEESSGVWDLPGGSMEHGENVFDTLKREVKEEMGVECEILDQTPFTLWSGKDVNGNWRLVLCYRIKLLSKDFRKSKEFVSFKYLNKKESEELNIYPLAKQVFDSI